MWTTPESCYQFRETATYSLQSALQAAGVGKSLMSSANNGRHVKPKAVLGSVDELRSVPYRSFMAHLNALAEDNKLQPYHDNWSKVWEYPWIWFNSLSNLELQDKKILVAPSGGTDRAADFRSTVGSSPVSLPVETLPRRRTASS